MEIIRVVNTFKYFDLKKIFLSSFIHFFLKKSKIEDAFK